MVQNAWFSPQDPDYCIWFKFFPSIDDDGNIECEANLAPFTSCAPNDPGQSTCESQFIDPSRSREFSTSILNGCDFGRGDNFHCSTVSGTIDTENNIINISIDRTHLNLGVENFTGQFIDIREAGFEQVRTFNCNDEEVLAERDYMMLLTSPVSYTHLTLPTILRV